MIAQFRVLVDLWLFDDIDEYVAGAAWVCTLVFFLAIPMGRDKDRADITMLQNYRLWAGEWRNGRVDLHVHHCGGVLLPSQYLHG